MNKENGYTRPRKTFIVGPLFNWPYRRYMRIIQQEMQRIADQLLVYAKVVLAEDLFDPVEVGNHSIDYRMIFRRLTGEMEETDLFIAVHDGIHTGEVGFLMGVAWAKSIPIWVMRVDCNFHSWEMNNSNIISSVLSDAVKMVTTSETNLFTSWIDWLEKECKVQWNIKLHGFNLTPA
jgi:nucleoside 2-deoxyribosyltransferase